MIRKILYLLFCLSLISCGYALVGTGNFLPPDIQTIRVDMLENNSYKFGLENPITSAIIDKLSSSSNLSVINSGPADAVVRGVIRNYSLKPIEIDQGGFASKYQISITMQLNLIRIEDNSEIWADESLVFFKELDVSRGITDTMEFENEAIEDMAQEIADRTVMSMLMNF